MILTENSKKWSSIISESLQITNPGKLAWMSQYAANHEVFEALQSGDPAAGIYSTPLNTLGMGNPSMPFNPANPAETGLAGGQFGNQKVGSGDIPMST